MKTKCILCVVTFILGVAVSPFLMSAARADGSMLDPLNKIERDLVRIGDELKEIRERMH
jgi:hypothetical protein